MQTDDRREIYSYDRGRLRNRTVERQQDPAGSQTYTYRYDAQGNTLSDGENTYLYDCLNRITEVKTKAGDIQKNHYDAEGLRSQMEENGKLVSFIYVDPSGHEGLICSKKYGELKKKEAEGGTLSEKEKRQIYEYEQNQKKSNGAGSDSKSGTPSTTDRIRNVAQQSFDYAVNNPRKQGLNRRQLGKDAEIQATRWTRKWAERNGIDLSESGLHFQVRGEHSIPDVVYEPTKNIMDFKLTPKAVRKKQSDNFKSDFPGYSIEYIFGPGPWREQDEH